MITRIVKMTFQEDKLATFLNFLEPNKPKIRGFECCKSVDFLQEIQNPNVLMTYSIWESEQDLENYRNSELFKFIWANTKIHFAENPQAWTLNKL